MQVGASTEVSMQAPSKVIPALTETINLLYMYVLIHSPGLYIIPEFIQYVFHLPSPILPAPYYNNSKPG